MASTNLLVGQLSLGTVAAAVPILLCAYLLASAGYCVYFHPLSKYPGPRLWALTRIPYIYHLRRGQLPQTVKALHDKYGKVIRLAPDELSFIDGAAWKDIYTPKPGHGPFDKEEVWLNRAVNGAYSVLTAPTFHEHARIKRFVQHGFSDKALRAQETMFQDHVDTLVTRMRELITAGEKNLNMFNWFAWATADIMGDLSFGEAFGCLKDGKDHHWMSILIQQFPAVITVTCIRFFPLARKLFQWYIPYSSILDRPREIHRYAVEKIDQRLSKDVERPDYVYYLQRENKDDDKLSRAELDSTLSTLIVAGGETTAAFLSGITFYLVQHVKTLRKLEKEVRDRFASEEEITAAAVCELPYFDACVKEGLRLCPAVAFGHPRFVPKGGDQVLGQWLPGGTKLTLMAYATYYSERNFKDADAFVPERWLEWNGYDDQAAFQPFSLGPRNCIGKNLALVELRIILARVIWNFNIRLPEGRTDMGWKWGDQNIFMLWQCKPMVVQVTDARSDSQHAANQKVSLVDVN